MFECKGCDKRHPKCHDRCESYLKAKREIAERNSMIFEHKKKENEYYGYKNEARKRLGR